jgi:hypothetical protein
VDVLTELPRGTVTFLFTDIAGSTGLWEQDRAAMAQGSPSPVECWVGDVVSGGKISHRGITCTATT